MISFLITILKLIIILGVVTTIHEFGHFIISKAFKIGVGEFSIGFGPKIIQKKYKDTMYSLRWIPLGGYCAIEGEGEESDSENSFSKKSTLQKVLVLIAGVCFNAILAIVIFLVIAFSLKTVANTNLTKISDDSILKEYGIKEGDTITKINGKNVSLASELIFDNYTSDSKDLSVSYLQNGVQKDIVIKDAVKDIGYIGVSFVIAKDNTGTNEIEMVAAGSSAAEAGLKAGDKIVGVNEKDTLTSTEIINIIRASAGSEVTLKLDRKGEQILKTLVPNAKKIVDLGIEETGESKVTLGVAITYTIDSIKSIFSSYVELFKGHVKVNEMSGIIGIGEVVSKTDDVSSFFNLMAIISLAVGIANILPFPPLDGGKVVIVLGEAITKKKLSLKAETIITYIGFGALILLTIFVTYNDIVRII